MNKCEICIENLPYQHPSMKPNVVNMADYEIRHKVTREARYVCSQHIDCIWPEDFGYNPSEYNEQFTAKMSFYALLESGKRIPCSKFSQKNLAALLLGKSSVDRENRTGEKFNLEKTNGCFE